MWSCNEREKKIPPWKTCLIVEPYAACGARQSERERAWDEVKEKMIKSVTFIGATSIWKYTTSNIDHHQCTKPMRNSFCCKWSYDHRAQYGKIYMRKENRVCLHFEFTTRHGVRLEIFFFFSAACYLVDAWCSTFFFAFNSHLNRTRNMSSEQY